MQIKVMVASIATLRYVGPMETAEIRLIRQATGLTQREFSATYRVPLGTLRDWEQGKVKPDGAALALMLAIRGDHQLTALAISRGERGG